MKKSEELKQLAQDLHDAKMNLAAAEERLTTAEEAFQRFAESLDDSNPEPEPKPKRSNGGRPRGIKNKPKDTVSFGNAHASSKQTDFNPALLGEKETLVSLFDKHGWSHDERAHFISKQTDKSESALINAFKESVWK